MTLPPAGWYCDGPNDSTTKEGCFELVVLPACSCGAPATHDQNPVVAELYPGQDPREFLCDACFDELAGDI